MNPHDEEEVAKAIFAIEAAVEALHEVSVSMLDTLKSIDSTLKNMDRLRKIS
jgi:hypothetical protein